MHIVAGKFKGRRLLMPKDKGVRPLTNYARQAIFSVLEYCKYLDDYPNLVREARVLDCFCGSGAVGLEALSRGATSVTFVDASRDAIGTARQNVENAGAGANCRFIHHDARRLPKAAHPFDLIFITPPHGQGLTEPTLKSLRNGGYIDPQTTLVIESAPQEDFIPPPDLTLYETRDYGTVKISYCGVQEK